MINTATTKKDSKGARTGFEEFVSSCEALPQRYDGVRKTYLSEARSAQSEGIKSFGKKAERVVYDVFTSEGLQVLFQPEALYEFTVSGSVKRRVRPDLKVGQRSFVEVTKWGDSNKMASMLANGVLVKHKIPDAKFYAIVASYKSLSDLSWTDDEEVDFWLGDAAKIFSVQPIDGYFGFA
ncbi:MAG: hypothetical protein WAW23_12385, partial [Candidatus Methanoperedens sp.]